MIKLLKKFKSVLQKKINYYQETRFSSRKGGGKMKDYRRLAKDLNKDEQIYGLENRVATLNQCVKELAKHGEKKDQLIANLKSVIKEQANNIEFLNNILTMYKAGKK